MLTSVTMMCAGSLAIACTAYLRRHRCLGAFPAAGLPAVPGLSVDGEYGTTATYMSEVALRGQRGFFSSFQYVTLIGGQLLAVLVIVILEHMQKYLVNTVGLPIKTTSYVMTVALFVYMCMQPLFGALSDRIGRRNNMLLFGGLGAVATVPILTALQGVTSPVAAFLLIILALAIVSFYTSISGIVKAEMFPPEVRALGVGLAYAVANAIFGGSAEYVALGLKSLGHESAFFWYVTGMMVLAFAVAWRLPKQASYLQHDARVQRRSTLPWQRAPYR